MIEDVLIELIVVDSLQHGHQNVQYNEDKENYERDHHVSSTDLFTSKSDRHDEGDIPVAKGKHPN